MEDAERIAELEERLEIKEAEIASLKSKYTEIRAAYKHLRRFDQLYPHNIALVLHYKEYMELYQDLFDKTQHAFTAYKKQYAHFYEDWKKKRCKK